MRMGAWNNDEQWDNESMKWEWEHEIMMSTDNESMRELLVNEKIGECHRKWENEMRNEK